MTNFNPVKNILVTGATGFIGVKLIESLEKLNVDIFVAGRNEIQLKHVFSQHPFVTYDDLDFFP